MSIDSVGSGFIPNNNLPLDGGKVGIPTPPSGGREVDSASLSKLHEQLRGLVANGAHPAAGLPEPKELDKQASTQASASLSMLGGDQVNADIYAFMALFAKISQSMRDTARTQRSSELQAQVSALTNAAEKMKDAAALRFAGAVVQGAMQIAGGLVQVGMSSASMANTIKGAQMDTSGKNMLAEAKMGGKSGLDPSLQQDLKVGGNNLVGKGAEFTAKGGAYQGYGQAAGSIAAGAGTSIGGGLTYAADLKEADKAKQETEAKVHETGVQHANDMMQQMMDVIRDVRDKLQSIQQASIETNRGIARNI